MKWETVIGLEVHAQLKTKSKLFSGAATHYGAPPNSQTSFIDAGLPGTLPSLNEEALRMAIQFGLAVDAQVQTLSYFERKNYFYPDLPKGYQISQFRRPIVHQGHLAVEVGTHQFKTIQIAHAHLEEDAGKSLHDADPDYSGIDLNRAGIPLLEIVTTPCLSSAHEVVCYLKTLHQLLRYLNICDGNMQEGSFRCDVNLSLRPWGETTLGTRTELKNLNSFRFIEKAIIYEQHRHQEQLEAGLSILQETRHYCPNTDTTAVLRSKENETDYRYFPDPDLLPIEITAQTLKHLKTTLPELPSAIKQRLLETNQLSIEDVDYLLSSKALVDFFEDVKHQTRAQPNVIVNWLRGIYTKTLNDLGLTLESPPVSAKLLASLLNHLNDKTISTQTAKTIFGKLLTGSQSLDELMASATSEPQTNDETLEKIIKTTIHAYPQQAEAYREGKEKLLAFFVGQVMKELKGQAEPSHISDCLRKLLK